MGEINHLKMDYVMVQHKGSDHTAVVVDAGLQCITVDLLKKPFWYNRIKIRDRAAIDFIHLREIVQELHNTREMWWTDTIFQELLAFLPCKTWDKEAKGGTISPRRGFWDIVVNGF